jgi:methylenetetrahydrofolate--tRNA-(uracil-5-)-methyltransferase
MEKELIVIGGGFAGSEAAWQAARRGVRVTLYEMRPVQTTPAHKTGELAELVCSNSFGSSDPMSAPGLLKEEMRRLGSLVLRTAEEAKVPAGAALAVDREIFARKITDAVSAHPNITLLREEAKGIPSGRLTILATGPLTSEALTEEIHRRIRSDYLYFFDAISPIIDAETIDTGIAFRASRYGKGGEDYLNCPMTEEQYGRFYDALLAAERVVPKEFEKIPYFESCLPIEVIAERGRQSPLFGPMKPVGLIDPRTGREPHAVVQLRLEDRFGASYNMVGFQTRLKWPEQKRVFRMIPGLEEAEFLRLGSLHRNTFINSPLVLTETLRVREDPDLFFAGQIVGVEGYIESAAMGLLAGIHAARILSGKNPVPPPAATAHGALIQHVARSNPTQFQPMNTNFGLFPPLDPAESAMKKKLSKEERRRRIIERALSELSSWMTRSGILDDISG